MSNRPEKPLMIDPCERKGCPVKGWHAHAEDVDGVQVPAGRCNRASDCDYPACWVDGDCAHLAWTGDGLPTTWRDE